jgi:DNA replication protein DnaD
MTNDFKDWEQAGINTLKKDRDYVKQRIQKKEKNRTCLKSYNKT